jgi:hypothetical protein
VTRLEAALVDVAAFLGSRRVPWMVFGGWAVLRWGRARLTEDIDIKVVVDESGWPTFVSAVAAEYEILVTDPLAFLRTTRVLPLRTRGGVRVDLVVAGIAYEAEAVARAHAVELRGTRIHVCGAEDLILHKLVSDRARDREDVEAVVLGQRGALDRGYLDPRVAVLARDLERPDILDFYRDCLARAGLAP